MAVLSRIITLLDEGEIKICPERHHLLGSAPTDDLKRIRSKIIDTIETMGPILRE